MFRIKLPAETIVYFTAWFAKLFDEFTKAQYLQIIKLVSAPQKAPAAVDATYQTSNSSVRIINTKKSTIVAIIAAT